MEHISEKSSKEMNPVHAGKEITRLGDRNLIRCIGAREPYSHVRGATEISMLVRKKSIGVWSQQSIKNVKC